jgi:hypothetical protein
MVIITKAYLFNNSYLSFRRLSYKIFIRVSQLVEKKSPDDYFSNISRFVFYGTVEFI